MDVVYVQSDPARQRGLASEPELEPAQYGHDEACSAGDKDIYQPNLHTPERRRQWSVTITVNDHAAVPAVITDPFLETQYKDVFEHYLRDSDRPKWSAEAISSTLLEPDAEGISRLEDQIRAYGEALWSQLEGMLNLSRDATECQIYIVESGPDSSYNMGDNANGGIPGVGPGIHCLAWELLEADHVIRMPKLRVTRISKVPPPPRPLRSHRPGYRPPHPLAAVQADPNLHFYVLLVVARDFSRSGAERDPEPDLAQWPLMNTQRKVRNRSLLEPRSRLLLEVVRPGSREELADHLDVRASQGVYFHLVHFDLHGRVMSDEHGNQVPWLLFARQNHVPRSHGYQVPQTHLAKAEDVAAVLARYEVENVVLNACLSAYNRSGSATSLAHIFLDHGICNVSAMWFFVHWRTVATYLDTFYDELLYYCKPFHIAAQLGREAIRQKPTSRIGREYQDFFLCVNYSRMWPTTRTIDPMTREPSPAPSARSQGSATSNASARSFMSGIWKPASPRPPLEAPHSGGEQVMRMQLHLLELEYKLMTFRVVYASDLRRQGSKLGSTMDKMADMWLNTNLVDEVLYYKAKDFARSALSRSMRPGSVRHRDRRTRATNAGYLQMLFPVKPMRALRQTLHVVDGVDAVVAPGYQADAGRNEELELRRSQAQAGLRRFAERLHEDGHSYLLFLGSEDAQWWRTHLQHLRGEWWVHLPWSYTVHSRYIRDVRLPTEERKPKLGIQG
ncbi:hypothetical protein EDB81DRAFT_718482 [Dactylonectria macrodidyma]|uniref:CHAT domain-containing protein n=1 Tax=Dactylonectria macrodidyma TaxID=307937 RepID=A0A9P9F5X2_9HYPO|nr:hypothetical protein EDB81DRAFT_718482 [Dactylonectria macrodidyma]